MIDTVGFNHLEETMGPGCRIVFIGDVSQLAPVMEQISPIYDKNIETAMLTEPMRNAEKPALVALCSQVRSIVQTGNFTRMNTVPGVVDRIGGAEFQKLVGSTFAQDNPSSRILCFTNKRVKEYNDYIRQMRGQGDMLYKGETCVVGAQFVQGRFMLRVEELVTIGDVDPTIHTYTVDGLKIRYYTADIRLSPMMIAVDKAELHLASKTLAKRKNWPDYFELKNTFPDLRQPDACTVYKAQGSTYDSVFLDLSDIGSCFDGEQVARMLYVGVTRPRSNVYLYGSLPHRWS